MPLRVTPVMCFESKGTEHATTYSSRTGNVVSWSEEPFRPFEGQKPQRNFPNRLEEAIQTLMLEGAFK